MQVTGTGSITQVDKSRSPYRCKQWLLQVRTSKGRKTQRFTGTRQEAQAALNTFISLLENDKYMKLRKFSDYADYWLSFRTQTGEFSPNTLKTDYKYVKKLKILFPNKNLTDLTPQLIRDALANAKKENNKKEPLAGTSKNHMYFTLNQILKMALDDDLIPKNPCDKVKPPKKDTLKKKALNKKELNKLFNALESEPMDGRIIFIYLMVLLGLRRGEAIALQWSDWNAADEIISISKSYKEANSSLGPTKTKAGTRDLPVPEKLTEILKTWKKVCRENKIDSDYICCNTYGNIMAGGACYKWWRAFKTKYKLPDLCYHELRHTNLTIVKNHLNVFDLKDYAGWEDIEMAKVYIHKDLDSMRKGISQVNF